MTSWMAGLTDSQLARTLAYTIGYLQGTANIKTFDNEDQCNKEFAVRLLEGIEKHAQEAKRSAK
ncbi:hypothetical protein [Bacillus sp. 1P06AnD]|uniref:hypothetical protein n=1 Tax=Bacillus sp. 1P06AnD TaxID=3132208 RepID=UPI0039A0B014